MTSADRVRAAFTATPGASGFVTIRFCGVVFGVVGSPVFAESEIERLSAPIVRQLDEAVTEALDEERRRIMEGAYHIAEMVDAARAAAPQTVTLVISYEE